MKRYAPLFILLFGVLVLSGVFMSSVPVGYGPDEPSHFGYVRQLAKGRGLPMLGRDTAPDGPTYEAHQPPLYYALAAPFFLAGRALGGEAGAWSAVRLFTLLCGLATVVAVFGLAQWLFPGQPAVAILAGAFAGWLPSQVALFSVVSNDPLAEFGFTATFLLLAMWAGDRSRQRLPLWMGLVAGLTFWVKASALVLVGAVPSALILATWKGDRRDGLKAVALFGAGFLGAAPWMIRNGMVYGDPLGWKVFVAYFHEVMRSPTPVTFAALSHRSWTPGWYWGQAVAGWAFRDSLGMWLFTRPGRTAPLKVSLPPEAYLFWGGVWMLAAAGWLLHLRKPPFRGEAGSAVVWTGMMTALGALLLAYVRLNATFFWAHSRYLFPAVAPLGLLLGVGLTSLAPERARAPVAWSVAAVFFFLSLFAGYALLGGFFASG